MIKFTILLLTGIFFSETIAGQNTFHGSFLMSFNSSAGNNRDYPMLWNIETLTDGGRMVLEIQDEMQKKGVSKRVLFNPVDSTWTMMMEYNKVKQGSRIHAAAMYRDTVKQAEPFKKITKEKRVIDGYHCKKIYLESDKYVAEVWITDQVKFDLCNIYKLLSHCGMMSEFIRKGDWYYWKNTKGMILEVLSKNKSTGESYTMYISGIKPGEINKTFFTINGFRISDIPEGQNCGVVIEEK